MIGNKIAELLAIRGVKPGTLAKETGIPKATIYSIIKRNNKNVGFSIIEKIADFLGVPVEYFYGDGANEQHTLSADALSLARDFDTLDEYGQRVVRAVSDIELERCRAAKPHTAQFPRPVQREDGFTQIRVYDQRPAAGIGNYLDESATYHEEQYPSSILPDGVSFGIVVGGASMEPEYLDGAVAFVHATEDVRDGDIILCAKNGDGYIKQLSRRDGRTFLHSLNEAYQDIPITDGDSFRTFGKILGHYP